MRQDRMDGLGMPPCRPLSCPASERDSFRQERLGEVFEIVAPLQHGPPRRDASYRVHVTKRIDVDPDAAWRTLARFESVSAWFAPMVDEIHATRDRRVLRFAEGTVCEEEVDEIDDDRRVLRYIAWQHCAPAGPLAASIAVQPFEERAVVSWSAAFESHRPARAREILEAVFSWGIRSLELYLQDRTAGSATHRRDVLRHSA